MKKVFLSTIFILMVAIPFTFAQKQISETQAHETILKALIAEKDKGNLPDFASVVNLAKQEGTSIGINENTSVGDFQYLVNGTVTSFETYINYLESNNKISAGFKNAIIQLYGDLSADKVATEQSYTQIINDYKLSNRYLSSESENVDRYSKMLIASMSFWKTNEQTKGDEMARGCRCGFFCWLCVGIFDAAGTIAGSPVGGAIASFVARCCICSCCKGISNNSSYCNPGN